MIFNCTINEKYWNEIDIHQVFFSHGSEIIDEKYVEILNASNVQLTIPKASLVHNGEYTCQFTNDSKTEIICRSDAYVGCKFRCKFCFKLICFF